MIVFTDEQVGTIVEEICGEAVCSNFEDVECGPDHLHPISDDKYSSDKDEGIYDGVVYSSGDDDTKEVYTDPALLTRA